MIDESSYPDEIIKSLSSSVHWGHDNLVAIPGLLRIVLENDMWRKRYVKLIGKTVEFDQFEDFVTALPPEGLGSSIQILRSLCHEHPDLLDMISNTIGTSDASLNDVHAQPELDVTAAQRLAQKILISRLTHDRQIMVVQELEQGRLTLNQAAQAARYNDLRIAVSKIDAASAAQTLISNISPDVLRLLIRILSNRLVETANNEPKGKHYE